MDSFLIFLQLVHPWLFVVDTNSADNFANELHIFPFIHHLLVHREVVFNNDFDNQRLASSDHHSDAFLDMFVDSFDQYACDFQLLLVRFYSLGLNNGDDFSSVDLLFSLGLDSLSNIVLPNTLRPWNLQNTAFQKHSYSISWFDHLWVDFDVTSYCHFITYCCFVSHCSFLSCSSHCWFHLSNYCIVFHHYHYDLFVLLYVVMSDSVDFILYVVFIYQMYLVLFINFFLPLFDLCYHSFPTPSVLNHFDIQDHSSHTKLAHEVSDSNVFANFQWHFDTLELLIPKVQLATWSFVDFQYFSVSHQFELDYSVLVKYTGFINYHYFDVTLRHEVQNSHFLYIGYIVEIVSASYLGVQFYLEILVTLDQSTHM